MIQAESPTFLHKKMRKLKWANVSVILTEIKYQITINTVFTRLS